MTALHLSPMAYKTLDPKPYTAMPNSSSGAGSLAARSSSDWIGSHARLFHTYGIRS